MGVTCINESCHTYIQVQQVERDIALLQQVIHEEYSTNPPHITTKPIHHE